MIGDGGHRGVQCVSSGSVVFERMIGGGESSDDEVDTVPSVFTFFALGDDILCGRSAERVVTAAISW